MSIFSWIIESCNWMPVRAAESQPTRHACTTPKSARIRAPATTRATSAITITDLAACTSGRCRMCLTVELRMRIRDA